MGFLPFRGSRCHISQFRVKKNNNPPPPPHSTPAWHRNECIPICWMFDFFFFLVPCETGGGFSGETNVSVRFWISSPEDTGITCFGNEQLSTIQVNDESHCNTHTHALVLLCKWFLWYACVCVWMSPTRVEEEFEEKLWLIEQGRSMFRLPASLLFRVAVCVRLSVCASEAE